MITAITTAPPPAAQPHIGTPASGFVRERGVSRRFGAWTFRGGFGTWDFFATRAV